MTTVSEAPAEYDVPDEVTAPVQHAPVPSETAGYLAPGGKLRTSIRDRIAAARPFVSELVPVEEWDSTIEIRSLSLGERQAMMVQLVDDEGNLDKEVLEAAYIQACSWDPETGKRVFADDDLDFIQSRPAGSMDKLGNVAMRLSGNAAKPAAEAQEDEAKK